eukprot:TRINITY_DN8537_c0_g1_i1.p1 TRINITY_DN8537_c0_g1~~TRINITY_DN8537_c0_g1_i1.p1  ORF type:complete len:283 (+),score=41.45 TRINITY_DN8537_c0_g1_i1:121-969(+)
MDDYHSSSRHPPFEVSFREPSIDMLTSSNRKRNALDNEEDHEPIEIPQRKPQRQMIPSLASLLASDSPPASRMQPKYNTMAPFNETKIPFLLPGLNSYYNPLNPPIKSINVGFNIPPMYSPQFSPEYPPLREPAFLDTREIVVPKNQYQYYPNFIPQEEDIGVMEANLKKSIDREIKERCRVEIPKSPSSMEVSPFPNGLETTDNLTTTNRFILVQQPNEIQRKSYKKENRCLLPNPLIICVKESGNGKKLPQILDGVVSLKLVNNDGSELPPHKQKRIRKH